MAPNVRTAGRSAPPRLVGRPVEGFTHAEAVALALVAGVTALLFATAAWNFELAGRLCVENGPIEWTQVTLFFIAGVLRVLGARRCAALRRPEAPDVILAAGFAILVIGEVDLDKVIFGTKVIHTRFFVDGRVWLPYRVLAVVVEVGAPLALAVYSLRHWRELLLVLWQGPRTGWGRLYLAGGLLFILVEILERQLGTRHLPKYFLEELFELISAIFLIVGSTAQPLAAGLGEPSPEEVAV